MCIDERLHSYASTVRMPRPRSRVRKCSDEQSRFHRSPTCAYGPRPYAFSSAMSSSSRALTGFSSCSGSSTGGGIAANATQRAPLVCWRRETYVQDLDYESPDLPGALLPSNERSAPSRSLMARSSGLAHPEVGLGHDT